MSTANWKTWLFAAAATFVLLVSTPALAGKPGGGITKPVIYDAFLVPGLGGAATRAHDVNQYGEVVGSADRADGTSHGFLYDSSTGQTTPLYDFAPDPTWRVSVATGINEAGRIAGAGGYWEADGSRVYKVYVCDLAFDPPAFFFVPDAPAYFAWPAEHPVNALGDVAYSRQAEDGRVTACIYCAEANDVFVPDTSLDDVLPPSVGPHWVNAINERWQLVGAVWDYDNHVTVGSYLYTYESDSAAYLPDLDLYDINDSGVCCGQEVGGKKRAVLYDANTHKRTFLANSATAEKINNDGDVAGIVGKGSVLDYFLYTNSTLWKLNDLVDLSTLSAEDRSKWVNPNYLSRISISERNETGFPLICVECPKNGTVTYSFLLVPRPSSAPR